MPGRHSLAGAARALDSFGHRLLSELLDEPGAGNVFVSPLSIALALALAYEGAKGETRHAIAQAIGGGTEVVLEELLLAYERLLEVPEQEQSRIELAIANSVWVDRSLRLRTAYPERIEAVLGAQAHSLDFADPSAPATVNAWVRDHTHGEIREIVSDLSAMLALLLNAVYFKGAWSEPFDPARTRPGPFTIASGARKALPLMRQSGEFQYLEDEHLQAIQLPYGRGRLRMEIYLPRAEVPLREIAERLRASAETGERLPFAHAEGDLVLPRFELEYGTRLRSALARLGMELAFTPQADFGEMADEPLMFDEVLHKAVLRVDEEGTVAAATTAVVMRAGGPPNPRRRFSMVVDRPFFCAIRDGETGAPLFLGFVAEPEEGQN